MRLSYALALAALLAAPASAQYQVTAPGVPVVEDFNAFRGTGFSGTPTAGQLNSNNVSIVFNPNLRFDFGETPAAAQFARGAASAPVTNGGVYAFEVGGAGSGNFALGFQPSGTGNNAIMTTAEGLVYFRFQNATGQTLRAAEVSVDYVVRNDQGRSTAIDLFYYTTAQGEQSYQFDVVRFDGASKFTTPAAGTSGAGWTTTPISARYDGLTWGPGEFMIVGFYAADVAGTEGRDEIAINNLSVTGIADVSSVTASTPLGSRQGAGNDAGWHLLSAPVQGLTVSDLAAQNLVQGLPLANPDRQPVNVLTAYRASAPVAATSTAEVVEPGRGFWWYLYDDATVASGSRELPFTAQATGYPRTGNVVVYNENVGASANRLFPGGNPFNVPFALSAVAVSRTAALFDAVNVWDPATQAYETRSRAFGDTAEPWSGFFLETVAESGLLTVSNATYITYGAAGRRPAGSPAPGVPAELRRIRFALEGQTTSGIPVADRGLALMFAAGGVDGYDILDGRKLEPITFGGLAAPASALVAFRGVGGPVDGRRSQDSRPLTPSGTLEIPVDLKTTEAGTYTLTWPLSQNVPSSWLVTLTDQVTGTVTDLSAAPGYTFTAAATPTWTERFTVAVTPGGATSAEEGGAALFALSDAVPNPAREASRFMLRLAQAQHVRAALYDALGRQVAEVMDGPVAAGDAVQIEAALSGLAPGVYVLRVKGDTFQAARRLTVVR